MTYHFRKAMDALYLVCVLIAGTALVLISAIIPWGVYTRYVLNSAASWPEPTAVLLMIWLTFFGAAACYRLGIHMAVTVGVDLLPKSGRKTCAIIVEILMTVIAVFMVIYGIKLCQATWNNSIADFPFLSVGLVYSPIPFGGILTLFFIVEHLTIGRPASAGRDPHLPVE